MWFSTKTETTLTLSVFLRWRRVHVIGASLPRIALRLRKVTDVGTNCIVCIGHFHHFASFPSIRCTRRVATIMVSIVTICGNMNSLMRPNTLVKICTNRCRPHGVKIAFGFWHEAVIETVCWHCLQINLINDNIYKIYHGLKQ